MGNGGRLICFELNSQRVRLGVIIRQRARLWKSKMRRLAITVIDGDAILDYLDIDIVHSLPPHFRFPICRIKSNNLCRA